MASRRIFKTRTIDLLAGEAWIAPPKKSEEGQTCAQSRRESGAAGLRKRWPWIVSAILVVSAVGMSVARQQG